ncbi:MAG: FixH family protein [Zavarzinia sp.]|nr:FixH family protein [Zavarzinia sp.]
MTIASEIAPRRGLTGGKVALMLVAFFLTITAVDIVMITSAIDSQTGLVVEHSYERGLTFNDLLAREARQAQLGWKLRVAVAGGRLTVVVDDAQGQPVAAERIGLRLVRTSDIRLDRVLETTSAGDGRFVADLAGAEPGLWQAAITVYRGEDRFDRLETVVIP